MLISLMYEQLKKSWLVQNQTKTKRRAIRTREGRRSSSSWGIRVGKYQWLVFPNIRDGCRSQVKPVVLVIYVPSICFSVIASYHPSSRFVFSFIGEKIDVQDFFLTFHSKRDIVQNVFCDYFVYYDGCKRKLIVSLVFRKNSNQLCQ